MSAIPTDRGAAFATGGAGLFNCKFVRGALAVGGLPSLLRDLPQLVAGQRGEAALTCVRHAVRLLMISPPTPEVARQRHAPSVSKANTQGTFVICADRVREWPLIVP